MPPHLECRGSPESNRSCAIRRRQSGLSASVPNAANSRCVLTNRRERRRRAGSPWAPPIHISPFEYPLGPDTLP